jgi:hypothetical protein
MIIVTALRTHASATKTEELVAGRVGMEAAFHFSPEWDGLGKTAVFEAGGVAKDVIIGDDPCIVPHECMIEGAELRVGIYGMSTDGTIVIPTVYALVGTVKKGADPSGDESYPPTPTVGEQAIAMIQEAKEAARESVTTSEEAKEAADEVVRRADSGEFDGGYYTPGVSQPAEDIVRMSFTPSAEGMPSAESVDIKLPVSDSIPGGYYVPSVEQVDKNTMKVSFSASEENMEAVPEVNVTLPAGRDGDPGAPGKSAYEYAREVGFVGTEEDFAELLAGNSVKTFGAVGDGVTDDTAAFQAALAAERVVRVYGGTYKLSGELAIGDNSCLELSQDTVLYFTKTTGNCIVLGMSSALKGNHATVKVPYAFDGHVLHAFSNDHTKADEQAVPPWSKWDPQWKTGNYVSDLNICKEDGRGFHYMVNPGECKGTAVYVSAKKASGLLTYLWGVHYTGLRIAGAFTYGIHAQNFNEGWLHEMRIDAFIDACETGVCLEDCNNTYISAIIQPRRGYTEEEVYFPYAKNGIKLIRSKNTDLSGSRVWDWTNPDDPNTAENEKTTLYESGNEYQHIAMYGNCSGTILNDYRYHEHGDTRKWIYTDTARNLDTLTILQEPITRWFKPKDSLPYFDDGLAEHRLIAEDELKEYFNTDLVKNFTDVLPAATDESGAAISGTGYKEQYIHYSGDIIDSAYYVTTGFIPMAVGQTLYGKDMDYSEYDGNCRINLYDASKALIRSVAAVDFLTGTKYYAAGETTDGSFSIKVNNVQGNAGTAFVRFSIYKRCMGENPMVAIDEEIKYTVEGFLADGIKVKGTSVILTSPNGTPYRLTVADDGTIRGTAVE